MKVVKLSTMILAVAFLGSVSWDAFASRDGGGGGSRSGGGRGLGHDTFHRERAPQQVTKHFESHHKTKAKKPKPKPKKKVEKIPRFTELTSQSWDPPKIILNDQGNALAVEYLKIIEHSQKNLERDLRRIYREGYLRELKQEENLIAPYIIPSIMTSPGISVPENYFSNIALLPEVKKDGFQFTPFVAATDFQNVYFIPQITPSKKSIDWSKNANTVTYNGIPILPPDPRGVARFFYQSTKVEQPILEWKRVEPPKIDISNDVM